MSQTTSPSDPRRFSPASDRNREPILSVLREVLPATGLVPQSPGPLRVGQAGLSGCETVSYRSGHCGLRDPLRPTSSTYGGSYDLRDPTCRSGLVLEIAAGTGQHAAFFAAHFPGLRWQPTDRDADSLPSIAAWRDTVAAPNLLPPLVLDAAAEAWPVAHADAIFNANMIHISPWVACLGLVRGAGRTLGPGGRLVLYGPYMLDGEHTAPSNAAFDASLRARDPAWGVRDLADVRAAAQEAGLAFVRRVAMPANNQIVVFERSA